MQTDQHEHVLNRLRDIHAAATHLLATIRKWRLPDGKLDPFSDAASAAESETGSAVYRLRMRLSSLQNDDAPWPKMRVVFDGELALGGAELGDAIAGWSLLYDCCQELVRAGFQGARKIDRFDRPLRCSVNVDQQVVDRLQHAIELLARFSEQITPDEARNRWIYAEAMKGTAWKAILRGLTKKPSTWEPIITIPGVKAAVERHAEKHKLPMPAVRRAGRPKSKR